MKIAFIFNPFSGRNRRDPSLARALPAFAAQRRLDAELMFTRAPHHATQLAHNAIARGCQRIVAVGGDGTLNEVAQAVLGSPAALGLIPCGSGNGLARHLGIPTRVQPALELVTDPASGTVQIDAGEADGHVFFNVMGLGFDAEISEQFNRLTRRGLPAYARTGLSTFRRHRAEPLRILAPGIDRAVEAYLVAVANSAQYGNGAFIAPGASVTDGKLELVALPAPRILSALTQVTRLFLGSLHRDPRVARLSSAEFTVIRRAPGPIHTDGEVHAAGAEVRIRALPLALRIIVPTPFRERTGPFTSVRANPRSEDVVRPGWSPPPPDVSSRPESRPSSVHGL